MTTVKYMDMVTQTPGEPIIIYECCIENTHVLLI